MFKRFILLAIRNLNRNRMFSFLNLAGLAIGLASAIIILLWVKQESAWDQFYPGKERIYQVMSNREFNDEIVTNQDLAFPIASALRENFPEVENAAVTGYDEEHLFSYKEKSLRKKSLTVSPEFVDVFGLTIHAGEPSALNNPGSILISTSMAKALFGDEEALNKIIRINNKIDLMVAGIIGDVPFNSTLQYEVLIPFDYTNPWISKSRTDWTNSFFRVFVKMKSVIEAEPFNATLTQLVQQRVPDQKANFFLHPMEKWHLYSEFSAGVNTGGMIEYVRLFTIIAAIILLIASVNFMNLATARSNKRAMEVGIRKTIGSDRKSLFFQFLTESIVLAFLSLLLSIAIVYLTLPWFNELVGSRLLFEITDAGFMGIISGVTLITGILAGCYPAFYLSSFNPVQVLKGVFQQGSFGIQPRKLLVTAQFVISILLISATIIVYQQIGFVKSRQLGYNRENLLLIRSSVDTDKHFEAIKNELGNLGLTLGLSRSNSPITAIYNYTAGLSWKGMPPENKLVIAANSCDAGYFSTVKAKILEGREFYPGSESDSNSLILNEAAVKIMGLSAPVGTEIHYGGKKYNIIGVTENIVMNSPYKPVEPMMTMYNSRRSGYITLRLNDQIGAAESIAGIEKVFKKYNPAFPFEYQFVDEQFNKKFLTEELIQKLTNVFAALAIFICCLGLFGLAAYSAEQRTREIGIRKVLGATVQTVVFLLSKEFLKLVLLASLIAFPLAWWAMNNWLEGFAYRISISWIVFAVSGLAATLIALITVSSQAIRTALSNPVKSLRSE